VCPAHGVGRHLQGNLERPARVQAEHQRLLLPHRQRDRAGRAGGRLPYGSWTISDTQAALYDCNKVADTFGYTVTVVNTTTGQEYSVDPEIQNGGTSPTGD